MIKAIIFDFDGVLGDTFGLNMKICIDIGLKFSVEDFKDHHNGNVFARPKLKLNEETGKEYDRLYYARADKKYLFPLHEILENLNKGYKLFIISSNADKSLKKFVKKAGWEKYFKKVMGGTTERSKVKKFKMIFDEYSIMGRECIFVTDTLGDLKEGREAGAKTIAVTWGYHGENRLRGGKPDVIIHKFHELPDAVNKLNPQSLTPN